MLGSGPTHRFQENVLVALALPFPTETAPKPTRTTPLLVALPARPRIPDLDRTMQRLSDEHAQHTEGPVFPCPDCFTPALPFGR
jgi:hypothetical protein